MLKGLNSIYQYFIILSWLLDIRLTLKMPRKLFNPICAYRQTVWDLIRLHLEEQSDTGPHCLKK